MPAARVAANRAATSRVSQCPVRLGHGRDRSAAVPRRRRLVSAQSCWPPRPMGTSIETVEGLAGPGEMHPIQQAFIDTGRHPVRLFDAGAILAAKALLERNAESARKEIRDASRGILDRETGYLRPVHAVRGPRSDAREEPGPRRRRLSSTTRRGERRLHTDRRPAGDRSPVVPSEDVPETEVVGHGGPKTDAIKLVKGNAGVHRRRRHHRHADRQGALQPACARPDRLDRRLAALALPGCRPCSITATSTGCDTRPGAELPNPLPTTRSASTTRSATSATGSRRGRRHEEIASRRSTCSTSTTKCFPPSSTRTKPSSRAPRSSTTSRTWRALTTPRATSCITSRPRPGRRRGLEAAERVFEQTFRVHQVQQTPIEPPCGHRRVGQRRAAGHHDLDAGAVPRAAHGGAAARAPVKQIRIIKPRIGGGFGVKQEMLIEDIVGHLTMATGRPVGSS